MKNVMLFLVVVMPVSMLAQKPLATKRTDEFTKEVAYVTQWASLNEPFSKSSALAFIKFNKTNERFIVELRVATVDKVVAVDKGDDFYIKLANDSVIVLKNLLYTLSEKGAGTIKFKASNALGLHLFFECQESELVAMASNLITKCRLNTKDGYIEIEPEKEKYQLEVRSIAAALVKLVE